MAESPVLNEAARILKVVQAGTPADQALREGLTRTTRHHSAPGERRAVSRAVFIYFRWWRWLNAKDSLQKQLEAALSLQDRFDRLPVSLKPEALAARVIPDWLKAEMDDLPSAWLQQLQRDPVLWIRPKRGLESKVATALGNCAPASGLQLSALNSQLSAYSYSGLTDLYRTAAFQAGEFEIQDLASQLVGHACAPQPGETWWDTCAGEGGKTMHLSDLMHNKGTIWGSDRSTRRLAKLKERAARSGAFNYRAAEWDGGARLPTKTKFDGVLIDAPCSGVGTWQRNPHARWTTQPKDVQELAVVQRTLLDHAAPSVKSGGRLIYSVCTLTRAETTGVMQTFTESHPEFEAAGVWPSPGSQRSDVGGQPSNANLPTSDVRPPSSVLGSPSSVLLWPQDLNANGMFIAVWRKK